MIKKIIAAIIVILAIAYFVVQGTKSTVDGPDIATYTAQIGDLDISIVETGTIKPRSQVVIKNELDSSATITFLVEEGAVVNKGDLLVAFDASSLEDSKINQEIQLQNAEASFVSASENMAVSENQAQSDIEQAQLNYEFAQLDLEKYISGEYPNELTEIQQNIDLAEEELERAKYELGHSTKLYEEKYISETEFKADELAVKQKEKSVLIAKNNQKLLIDYSHKRKLAELESKVRQTEMALERTKRKAKADITQAKANLKAKEAEYKRQQDMYARITDQLSKTKLYAPADGMVIYQTSMNRGRWGSQENPMEVGQTIRGREDIIYLPTAQTTKAEIKIHESSLKKIQLGQKAIIKIDALPDVIFTGTIAKLSPLPDNNWMNPDVNKYPCEVFIDDNEYELKNGMNCRCEIQIDTLKNVIYVPLQAVVQIGDEHFVEVKKLNSFERRKVVIGQDNNNWIHIAEGLKEGEQVSLSPQLKDTEKKPGADRAIKTQNNQDKKQNQSSGAERGPGRGEGTRTRPQQGQAVPAGSNK